MNTTKVWKYMLLACLLMLVAPAQAQRFFNLTSSEVRVDSVLPRFVYSIPLTGAYRDSVYTVSLKYGEYIDMTASDIANYNRLSGAVPPEQVFPQQRVTECRRQGVLQIDFSPVVFRNNRHQLLVSFMLQVDARPLKRSERSSRGSLLAKGKVSAFTSSDALRSASSLYASHSVLASGRWAKIRVSETGFHQLTEQVVRQAGFSDISKVKIYGYGGNLQNEALLASELQATDDLQEVPQCIVGGKHYFYAEGPVSWKSETALQRIRNPYSDYGYYFITQTDGEPLVQDSATFVSSHYPQPYDYHSLYESDGFSYYHGGRNLFDAEELKVGDEKKVVITNTTGSAAGKLSVALTTTTNSVAQILKNGKVLGEITLSLKDDNPTEDIAYLKATEKVATYPISDFQDKDTISIKVLSGASIRLDYISVTWAEPGSCAFTAANLAAGGKIPAAQYVYGITNQNHHADGAADMVIIIPTSQKLLKQAQRLKKFHEQHDGLRVTIVPADELYNEFSSGTPDANAYRRYLRMLSDKAQSEADMPKYLLLFGDCVWDNRMLTSGCRTLNPDDYLLCFESENSFSAVSCFVSDSWFGMLGEGAGLYPNRELQDVAVGRFPVTYADEAQVLVDKTISYAQNANVGAWQNTLMFMGDDGNGNLHMQDADDVANDVLTTYPAYLVKKVMWDAYTRETSSSGNTYPEATRIIKQQQAAGALIMDYAGHGDPTQMSHESVLKLTDFADFRNTNLPLWVTASCDIMPFDGLDANIGEYALLNNKGGAVAFYGTTRTVYAQYNRHINRAFIHRVLSLVDGKPITIGEAHRLAQNDLVSGNGPTSGSDVTVNHLHYSLLGDPALALNLPMHQIVVDSINGIPVAGAATLPMLKAGSIARMAGHIEGADDFRGVITATVRDSKETVTCRLNDTGKDGAEKAFEYKDRTKTLYQGTDSVRGGKFTFSFAVPLDINYSNQSGLVNLYAVNTAKTLSAHGSSEQFTVGESEEQKNDSIGPSIYCYLNSPSFVDGGNVNTTPFFVAKITDKDGINAAGSGIGHDLQLVIDGDMSKAYVLNSNFIYDFGTYTSGSTYYSIPQLEPGKHELTFRAWDIQNNSSTVKLRFNVVKALSPALFDVGVTANPAKTSTTFIISHDRTESDMDVVVEVFDSSGRQHWRHSESGVPTSGSYTVSWDLTSDSGTPLGTGVYLYRVKVASDGSSYTSKVKKLIIIK